MSLAESASSESVLPLTAQVVDLAVDRLGPLPVLDRVLLRVQQLAVDEDATNLELVLALEADPNLAVDLLRFANSAACARPVRAQTLRQAVALVGRRALGRLATEAAIARFFAAAPGNHGSSHGQLHHHAVQVAAVAAMLAERAALDVQGVHLAGLLHDVGKVVLPAAFGVDRLDELTEQAPSGPARATMEWEALGCDHAWAGARLAAASGLDERVTTAIAEHHGGALADGCSSPESACVQAAEAAVSLTVGLPADGDLLDAALARLGLSAESFEEVVLAALPIGIALREAEGTTSAGLAGRVAALERGAREDELTGVLTRRTWSMEARTALRSSPGAVLLVDIDHFDAVNDQHGHATGDLVLSEVARLLAPYGLAGRLGGDEFALLVTPAQSLAVADAVVRSVREAFATPLGATVSVGVATTRVAGLELDGVLESADGALYAAKQQGRDRAAAAVPLIG